VSSIIQQFSIKNNIRFLNCNLKIFIHCKKLVNLNKKSEIIKHRFLEMDLTGSAAWRSQSDKAEVDRLSQLHYAHKMEQLLSIVGNREFKRYQRLDARQKANDLHSAHFSARIDWNEHSEYDISTSNTESDSGNSSSDSDVSDVQHTQSDKEWLWEHHMLDGDPNAEDKFKIILKENLQQKKQQKRALLAQAIAEEAARAARAAEIERQNRAKELAERMEKELSDAEESSSELLRGIFDSVADDES